MPRRDTRYVLMGQSGCFDGTPAAIWRRIQHVLMGHLTCFDGRFRVA